ncbi:nucleolar complex-associated protein-domain-containing protein [Schizophyllum amplum]|uniref:Nucleolar complex-associated protein-domain-containing protein n=1 Tax=Schizophyllum amplum TaxID=97359 RepID=A0A550BYH6_9AGAR|nr:nucleolar complex-associated protein-domain-containing protein [Auriculariopsis ampla]
MAAHTKKRAAPASNAPAKKRKLSGKPSKDVPKKIKASERKTVPLAPTANDGSASDVSEEDVELVDAYGQAASFLTTLDTKAIARSKGETQRLHDLHKPQRPKKVLDDDLPPVDSDGEPDDGGAWSSDMAEDDEDDDESLIDSDSDAEMPYEAAPRTAFKPTSESSGISRLPIKLADGRVQKTGAQPMAPLSSGEDAQESSDEEEREPLPRPLANDVATAARFGRPAVADVISTKSRKARLQLAKDQIAGICQDIVAEPENSLGLLKRLHSFSLPDITTPSQSAPVRNDPIIRKLAILSQLAVFKDVIPGYRIRALTEKEKSEKVSQQVSRQREFEQGLVGVYQMYLRALEAEIKARSDLAEVSLQSMCTLLKEVTHFNFRTNLMSCIVARLSKKSWDASSDLCRSTINIVFRADQSGTPSLEIVRLLNRMVKEKHFQVHPNALECLTNLRLMRELGSVRASQSKVDRDPDQQGKAKGKKGKKQDKAYLSKKARKTQKERKEIEREMHEAEEVVDHEERQAIHTETLKLIFVLYFRILKQPTFTPLLPAALRGIARFAHLVNIDFFRDLMAVLRELVDRRASDSEEHAADEGAELYVRLLCINTAFELLSGQGEALDIDLSDFYTRLYTLIIPLSMHVASAPHSSTQRSHTNPNDIANLLLTMLGKHMPPRALVPAFAKRLATACLVLPAAAAVKALEVVRIFAVRDMRVQGMIVGDGGDDVGGYDGIRGRKVTVAAGLSGVGSVLGAALDDPTLVDSLNRSAALWEVRTLQQHSDQGVRDAATRLVAAGKGVSD